MRFFEIKKEYDIAISLGAPCQPAEQLRRHKLRTFSGPFDWTVLESVPCLIKAIDNRFENYFARENLSVRGVEDHTYRIFDELYQCMSVHDFPLVDDPDKIFDAYPAFIEKMQRRIHRFFEKIEKNKEVLFVRYHANYEETEALCASLEKLAGDQFTLLLLNESKTAALEEDRWDIKNTCAMRIKQSFDLSWSGYSPHWHILLDGISVRDRGVEKVNDDPRI